MKAVVTVHSGSWHSRDVYIDADEDAPTAAMLTELSAIAGADPGAGATITSARGRYSLSGSQQPSSLAPPKDPHPGVPAKPQTLPTIGRSSRPPASTSPLVIPQRPSHAPDVPAASDVPAPTAARALSAAVTPSATPFDVGIAQGARIEFGEASEQTDPPVGSVEIVTVSGPGAGSVQALWVGDVVVGLGKEERIVVGAGVHSPVAVLTVGFDGTTQIRLSDSVDGARYLAAAIEETPLTHSPVTWTFGSYVHIGGTILRLRRSPVGAGQLRPDEESATLKFNRPPRLAPPPVQKRFTIPAPPKPPNRGVLPWIMALGPLVISVVLALALRHPFYLLFGLMSPMMMLGSWFSNRKSGLRTHRQMLADHRKDVAAIRRAIAEAVRAETALRREDYPDASDLQRAAAMPTRRLWERRRSAQDFLRLRVGVGNLPSGIEVTDNSELEYKRRSFDTLRYVPVAVDIDRAGVVGVAGPGRWPMLLTRWMVGQAAVLHLPRDLRFYILSPGSGYAEWAWARWLPHVSHGLQTGEPITTLGGSAESIMARIGELTAILAERKQVAGEGDREFTADSVIITVLDGARSLRSLPGVLALLREGPNLGMYTICIDESSGQLPEECTVEVVATGDEFLRVSQQDAEAVTNVTVDTVSSEWLEETARMMSPLREVGGEASAGAIPDSSRLLSLLHAEAPTADLIAQGWGLSPRSTSAVIGESFDGPFQLDISRDGPHALIAGTTGSGKSEFLQTLVASLAVVNQPDEMNFVLVDYKGGAAFAACSTLPHTVGFVTDLDNHLVQRALTSLSAELTRREHVLAVVGAKDIEDYQAAAPDARAQKLARLVIVIDEFAALAKELPDFVTGLVGIAQRGRSLGVHLVLATQRPTGVVSSDIRANTNLRIALRMTDKSESSDVIDAPDAASIPKSIPGRAYARLGHASLVPFQSARVGGRREISAGPAREPVVFLSPLTPEGFTQPTPRRPGAAAKFAEHTDLEALVQAIAAASAQQSMRAADRPWLPPLPEVVEVSAALERSGVSPRSLASMGTLPVPWGLCDLPREQSQEPLQLNLETDSHLFIAGAPGSGRTQSLRTLAGVTAALHSPADVHMYGVDCGNGGLSPLETLPHCGGVARASQVDRIQRMFSRLRTTVAKRADLLAEQSYSNLSEQRQAAPVQERLPHVLVFIDRWESFLSTLGEVDAGSLTEQVYTLLREGVSTGVHLIIAGDRSLLSTRISHLASNKMLLRFDDPIDYSLGGLKPKDMPASVGVGRAFQADSGRECQVGVLDGRLDAHADDSAALATGQSPVQSTADTPAADAPEVSGNAQAAVLREIGARAKERFPDVSIRPSRIAEMPARLPAASLHDYPEDREHSALFAAFGVGGDDVSLRGPDLKRDAPTFVVAGPARSGRSTVLKTMAESLLMRGVSIVVLAPMASPLRGLAGRDKVLGVFTEIDVHEETLAELTADRPNTVLVMDDGEMLKDMPAKSWLRAFIRDAKTNEQGLLVAGDVDEVGGGFGSSWNLDVKRAKRGMILSPSSSIDGDLIGVKLSRSICSSRVVLGDGYAHFGTGVVERIRLAR